MFDAVDRVDTPDPYTAVIRLSKPPPGADAVARAAPDAGHPPSTSSATAGDPKTHPMNAMPVGSGPFRFKEWVRGQHVILERNDDFFIEGRPLLDRIVVKYIKERSVRMLALEKGEVDYYPFAGLRFRDILRISNNPDLRVSSKGYEALGPVNYVEFKPA